MGDFLTTPNKEKVSEDSECPTVNDSILLLDEIRSIRNARLEKENGRLTYF